MTMLVFAIEKMSSNNCLFGSDQIPIVSNPPSLRLAFNIQQNEFFGQWSGVFRPKMRPHRKKIHSKFFKISQKELICHENHFNLPVQDFRPFQNVKKRNFGSEFIISLGFGWIVCKIGEYFSIFIGSDAQDISLTRDISQGRSPRVEGNLEGRGDGFPNTSRVLVKYGYSSLH